MGDFDRILSLRPRDSKENLYEHPLFSYITWKRYQKMPKKFFTYTQYLKCLTVQRDLRADTVLFYMDGRANTCHCYFFRKSQKCFHILRPTTKDFYEKAIKKHGNAALRSMLFCDIADETPLFETLNNLTLITHSKIEVMEASAVKCLKCNLVSNNLRNLNAHIKACPRKKIISTGLISSWRYELELPGAGDKFILDTNCILMSRGDLHHLIPLASKIYEKLETLGIKSSLLQIIAQDPLYQDISDVLVEQKQDDVLGTYSLYLYLVERLLPFIENMKYESIEAKMMPVYTVIRTEDVDALKDIIGFDGMEEQQSRVDSCPKFCRSAVKDILKTLVDQDLLKPEKEDLLRNMIHDGLRGEDKQIWALVVNCLDTQMCVFPIIRNYVLERVKDEVDPDSDWKIHRNFIYGQGTMLGDAFTNIFGVIPRNHVRLSTLKDVALFSRGKYIYLNHQPWKIKRVFDRE